VSEPEDPPRLLIVPSRRSERIDDPTVDPDVDHDDDDELDDALPAAPPPRLSMPLQSTLVNDDDETLEEKLFDLYGDILGEPEADACRMALDLMLATVRCEAGAIATRHTDGLAVRAAHGPIASHLAGRVVSIGTNAVSECFLDARTISVPDAASSSLHFPGADSETGFECFAALCVPVLDDEGLVYGVVELLNPTSRSFLDEDEEAIERIARVLGTALALA
jgi:transcriptional regulator with GAF, ATPase, and Fis domain